MALRALDRVENEPTEIRALVEPCFLPCPVSMFCFPNDRNKGERGGFLLRRIFSGNNKRVDTKSRQAHKVEKN